MLVSGESHAPAPRVRPGHPGLAEARLRGGPGLLLLLHVIIIIITYIYIYIYIYTHLYCILHILLPRIWQMFRNYKLIHTETWRKPGYAAAPALPRIPICIHIYIYICMYICVHIYPSLSLYIYIYTHISY